MKIEVQRPSPQVAVVHPQGRVDAVSAPDLRHMLRELPEQGAVHLVVDLRDVPFMDSSGLSALISGLKAARSHGGTLALVSPTPPVRMALELSMLDRIFPIYETVEAALQHLTGGEEA